VIFSENRFPLFGITLQARIVTTIAWTDSGLNPASRE